MIKAGTTIAGPGSSGYKITRDLNVGDAVYADLFDPFGGAEQLAPLQPLPPVIVEFFHARQSNG